MSDVDLQDLNFGAGPNTQTGDTLRAAFQKVQANFDTTEGRLNALAKGSTFTHVQDASAATWTVTHNLGRYPSVTVVDTAGSEVYGDVEYLSENQVRLSFSAPFSGVAYLN